MVLAIFLFVLALLGSLSSAGLLLERSPCDWVGAFPILGKMYYSDSCPPPVTINSNGDCPGVVSSEGECGGFCQVRTHFFYGLEQPFERVPFCRGGQNCEITSSEHQSYAWKAKINFSIKDYFLKALTIGITGGFNTKYGTAEGYAVKRAVKDGECGYFTFIPIVKEACGTFSRCTYYKGLCEGDYTTTANVCSTQIQEVNGKGLFNKIMRGIIVFVFVDCVTLEPLGPEKQDPAFNQPRVPLPRAAYKAHKQLWALSNNNQSVYTVQNNKPTCQSGGSQPLLSDCNAAVASITEASVGLNLPREMKGRIWPVAQNATCAVQVRYDDDWSANELCVFNQLWVMAAAQVIMDECAGNGGTQLMTSNGACTGTVILARTDPATASPSNT